MEVAGKTTGLLSYPPDPPPPTQKPAPVPLNIDSITILLSLKSLTKHRVHTIVSQKKKKKILRFKGIFTDYDQKTVKLGELF